MEAIQKFMEAAKAFQDSELYKNLATAREENDSDTELQEMIQKFNLIRLNLNAQLEKEERDEEKVAEMNNEINSLYNIIMSNEKMLAYNKSKQEVEKFMEYVNEVLNVSLEGGDPFTAEMPQAHGCSDAGCASCSGCG